MSREPGSGQAVTAASDCSCHASSLVAAGGCLAQGPQGDCGRAYARLCTNTPLTNTGRQGSSRAAAAGGSGLPTMAEPVTVAAAGGGVNDGQDHEEDV